MRTIMVLLVVLLGTPAVASPERDREARRHFAEGRSLYQRGLYADALAAFARGHEASGRPIFLFNMAECARLAGDTEQARSLYRRYLAEDGAGALAVRARERLEALGPEPAPAPVPAPPPPIVVEPAPVVAPPIVVAPPPPPPRRSLLRRWPFWAAVGGVIVVGSVAIYAATRPGDVCPGCPVVDLR